METVRRDSLSAEIALEVSWFMSLNAQVIWMRRMRVTKPQYPRILYFWVRWGVLSRRSGRWL